MVAIKQYLSGERRTLVVVNLNRFVQKKTITSLSKDTALKFSQNTSAHNCQSAFTVCMFYDIKVHCTILINLFEAALSL